ncbi:MAG TPA: hypothetical protein VFJ57_03865 [Solirubrobacterales bacterium]|nr:hypothetical protein [Solirubrobacterales bacterium]
MNEPKLRELLREVPVPGAEEAERRGFAVVAAAFAERQAAGVRGTSGRRRAARSRTPPRRLALALALAALAAALILSPAGASVRHWVGEVFSDKVPPRVRPGLARTPGGGRLLVASAAGPWVVQPDGSRRLLGDYEEATWSPRGLFVAAVSGRTLSAVEPDGTPHWSLTAPGRVSDPHWSPSRFRIAYRAGSQLRVAFADGSSDRAIAAGTAPVSPAWMPLGVAELAYVDSHGRLRIAESETGRGLASVAALPGVDEIEWGGHGEVLLESSPAAVRVRRLRSAKLALEVEIEPGRRLPLPAGAGVRDAALSPDGRTVAVLLSTPLASIAGGPRTRSTVLLFGPDGPSRRLLTVPGDLSELAFSPDGGRLLVAWPEADEWLFLPLGRSKGEAVGNVARAFAPGQRAAEFPRVEGWCCRAR